MGSGGFRCREAQTSWHRRKCSLSPVCQPSQPSKIAYHLKQRHRSIRVFAEPAQQGTTSAFGDRRQQPKVLASQQSISDAWTTSLCLPRVPLTHRLPHEPCGAPTLRHLVHMGTVELIRQPCQSSGTFRRPDHAVVRLVRLIPRNSSLRAATCRSNSDGTTSRSTLHSCYCGYLLTHQPASRVSCSHQPDGGRAPASESAGTKAATRVRRRKQQPCCRSPTACLRTRSWRTSCLSWTTP
jgi:hypothetical protein